MTKEEERIGGTRLENYARTANFWRRSTGIYLAYKLHQVKGWSRRRQGWDADRLRDHHWQPHHTWAGEEFYRLAVDLRGFYLKVWLAETRCPVCAGKLGRHLGY